jgi:divalent metal cation (Fe/Co/Zn/Cd) transporter
VDCRQPTYVSHQIAEDVRHEIFHELPAMVDVTVHVDPCECDPEVDFHPTAHHMVPEPVLE